MKEKENIENMEFFHECLPMKARPEKISNSEIFAISRISREASSTSKHQRL